MLRKKVQLMYEDKILLKDIEKEISDVIKKSVQNNSVELLMSYFGKLRSVYLDEAASLDLDKRFKNKELSEEAYFYKNLCMNYLTVALYFACQKGNLKIVEYLTNYSGFPGDLDVNVANYQAYFDDKNLLQGPPLSLAAQSGNLDLVKYLYEKTDALIENGLDKPIHSTPLMEAIKAQHPKIIDYLLEKGANPHSPCLGSFATPLSLAIKTNKLEIVKLITKAGAIVTAKTIYNAITDGIDLEIIKFLMKKSLTHEIPYEPYLLAAIKSGHFNLVDYFESKPEFNNLPERACYFDQSIEHKMLHAAAESGNVQMMKYMVEQKKLPLGQIASEEIEKREQFYRAHPKKIKMNRLSIKDMYVIFDTLLSSAVKSRNNIPLLQFLFEEQKIKPTQIVLKELLHLCSSSIQTVAYLFSMLEDKSPDEVNILRNIAVNLPDFSLLELFKVYNTSLVCLGNVFERHGSAQYWEDIGERIKTKEESLSKQNIADLVGKDKEAALGALFYYCSRDFKHEPEKFLYLLSRMMNAFGVDILKAKNDNGDTLESFAASQNNFGVVSILLKMGADPDLPNKQGKTMLNKLLSSVSNRDNFKSTICFAHQIDNSLLFESKKKYADVESIQELLKFSAGKTDIPISTLVANACRGGSKIEKLRSLFTYLSEDKAIEMVRLLRDPEFMLDKKLKDKEVADCFMPIGKHALSPEDIDKRLAAPAIKKTETSPLLQLTIWRTPMERVHLPETWGQVAPLPRSR